MMENKLPDARELSYQHLMAGSVNKHSRPHDRGLQRSRLLRSSLKHPGFRRKRTLFLQYSHSLKNSQSSLSKVSPAFNTFRLVQNPARTMGGSKVTEPRVKTLLPVKSLIKYFHNKSPVYYCETLHGFQPASSIYNTNIQSLSCNIH